MPDPPYPVPVILDSEFSSYSNQNGHVPQGSSTGSGHETNYDFWMGPHHSSSAGGSVSSSVMHPEQRPTAMDGTPLASAIPQAWQRSAYTHSGPAGSAGAFYVRKEPDGVPSPHFRSATTARTFSGPDDISSAFSPSGVRSVTAGARSPPSTFAPYPTSGSPKSPSISQGGTYQAPKCEPSSPSPPNRGSILCSVERPEQSAAPSPPAPAPLPAASLCGAAGQEHLKPVRTLRSVRTRFGDVYAEHEQVEEQGGGGSGGGRWVCQCGSTFVRDSDWERHAMHSLSHSAGGGFDCNLCDISFTRSDAMFRHRRKKHGIRNAPCRGPRESEDEGPQPLSRERQMTRFSMDKY